MRAIRPKLRSHAREHIVTIDTDSAPRIMFYGENFLLRGSAGRHARDLPEAADDAGREPARGDPLRANHPEDMRAAARAAARRA